MLRPTRGHLLGAVLVFLVVHTAGGDDGPRFPPYPEVWGYELPYGRPGDRTLGLKAYRWPDGDVRFTFRQNVAPGWPSRTSPGRPDYTVIALDVFKGTRTRMSLAEWTSLRGTTRPGT